MSISPDRESPIDLALEEFEAERDRLSLLTRKGIGMPAAGLLYWLGVALLVRALPQKTALVAPNWTPFTMAVLFGSHFLPYSWLYRSRGYGFLAIGIAIVAIAGIFIVRKPLYTTIPLLAAACYAVAVVMLWTEVQGLVRKERRG